MTFSRFLTHGLSRRAALLTLVVLLAFAPAASSLAQNATAQAPDSKPDAQTAQKQASQKQTEAVRDGLIPVLLEHDGEDKLGERLYLRLKETFGWSKTFRAAKKNEKALKLRLVTRTEIAERPEFGSAWMVVRLYVEGAGVLGYYLDSELGFVTQAGLEGEAEAIVAATAKTAETFSYLLE